MDDEKKFPDTGKAVLKEKGRIDIKKLKAHPFNQSIYGVDEDAVTGLASSIKIKGLINPIVVDGKNTIISGHLRWEAFRRLNGEEPDNPEYKEIPAEVREFSEETITDVEFLLISNEGRDRSIIQKIHELERWQEIMRSPRYENISRADKRDTIINMVGFGSQRTYERALTILKYIEELRKRERPINEVDNFFGRVNAIKGRKTFGAIEGIINKDRNKPSPEALLKADEEALNEIAEKCGLNVKVEDFEEDGDNPLKSCREYIASKLDIELEEEEVEEIDPNKYNYGELRGFSKYELVDLVEKHSLGIDYKDYKNYRNPIFLCRAIAKEIGAELPDFSSRELVGVDLDDLMTYSRKHRLGMNVNKHDDPYLAYLRKVGEHVGIGREDIDRALDIPFSPDNFRKTHRSLPFGRLKMAIGTAKKGKLDKIEIVTDKANDKIHKLAELITKVNSANIDDLLERVKPGKRT